MSVRGDMQLWTLMPGDLVFREGDTWDGLYLIKSGSVEIFQRRGSKDIRLGVLGPSEFIGTVTLLTRENRSASARALSETKLQHFDEAMVNNNFSSAPAWMQAVTKDILQRLKHVNSMLVETRFNEKTDQPDWEKCLKHVQQLTHLLITLTRAGLIVHEGQKIVKIDQFLLDSEGVLRLRRDYVQKMFTVLTTRRLVATQTIPTLGLCLINPSIGRMQAWLEFCEDVSKLEFEPMTDVEREMMPAFVVLAEMMVSTNFSDLVTEQWLTDTLTKAMPGVGGNLVVNQLIEAKYLDRSNAGAGKIRLNCPKILRTTSFDHIYHDLKTLSPAFVA